jgi:hypothetical protein
MQPNVAIYLYGLVLGRNAHLIPPHIAGIGGAAVRVLACDDLSALVSTIGRAPVRTQLDDVRAHDHALRSVVHHGATVVASRFGQTFASDEATARDVVAHGARVVTVLEECDGCVEMRLLISASPETAEPIETVASGSATTARGSGTAYLEGLRAKRTHSARLGLKAALGKVVRAERVTELPDARGAAFAHLVRRDDETSYREAVAAIPALAEAQLIGPLALYSFAEPD